MNHRAYLSFIKLLANLRWLAVAGQGLTILIVTGPLQVELPVAPLWAGIGALAVFNVYATWRARRTGEVSAATVFSHILIDVLSLTWMVAWSGGVENPISSLFLLPIALSIVALPSRWVRGAPGREPLDAGGRGWSGRGCFLRAACGARGMNKQTTGVAGPGLPRCR